MGILDALSAKPVDEVWEIVRDFLADEDTVDHMAAEQAHLDLIAQVQLDFLILVNTLENIGSGRPIGELKFVKCLLHDVECVPFLKIFNGHMLYYIQNLRVGVFKGKLCFKLFLL